MIIGEVNELKVKRVADISYVLEDGEEELFLHKKEALAEHKEGDMINVFIYLDSKRRVCASERTPLITASKPAFLKVAGVKEGVGYFLDDGMPKDLLLSKDDCIFEESEKPMEGDYLFVFLIAKGGTFRARLVPKSSYENYMKPDTSLRMRDYYETYVTSRTLTGLITYTLNGHQIFIPRGMDRASHRIGEKLKVQIIKYDENHNSYIGTLLKNKTDQLDEDAKKIYQYMKSHRMEILSENDSPIDIYQKFQMSKGAFKNACGHLYKEKLIEINDGILKLRVE